jgi:hypothetical protein
MMRKSCVRKYANREKSWRRELKKKERKRKENE